MVQDRTARWRRLLAGVLAVSVAVTANLVVTASTAHAVVGCGIGYAYDAAGRLVGVNDATGTAASYTYDQVGNTTAVQRLAAGTVRVQSFSPARGSAGTAVSITGGCFAPVATDNVVTFGGAAAMVTYASTHRLVAQVPAGAPSGPIGVTTSGVAATSTASFTVEAGVTGPLITSVTPTVVVPGQAVTVTGSGFDTQPLNDVASLNQVGAIVSAATSTSLTMTTPGGTSTGRVAVRTSQGEAVSASDVFVVPSPYTVGKVSQTSRVTLGTPQSVTIPTAGNIALVAFDLPVGGYASVSLSSGTFGSCGLTAYVRDPRATQVSALSCVGTSGWVDRVGGQAGTWVLLLASQTIGGAVGTGNVTVTVNPVPADATGTATVGGAAASVTTTAPGQNATITFTGTVGARVAVHVTGHTMGLTRFDVYHPTGLAIFGLQVSSGFLMEPQVLTATGTYTITLNPGGQTFGTTTLSVLSVPADAVVAATIGGPAVAVTTTGIGQNALVTFAGTAGQRVSTQFSGSTFGSVFTTLRDPAGATLQTANTGNPFLDTLTLPATGTYSILVNPSGTNIGSVTARVYAVPADVATPLTVGGAAATTTTTTPGQNAAFTFAGSVGQRVSVQVSGSTLGNTVFAVKSPAGVTLATSTTSGTGPFFDTLTLAENGTYSVTANPSGGTFGAATARAYVVPADVVAVLTQGGPAATVTTTVPGQNANLTFAGTAGDRVSVQVSGSTLGSTAYAVKSPAGATLVTSTTSGTGPFFDTFVLATTGTYTVSVNPTAGTVGAATVRVYGVPADATFPLTVGGAAVTATVTTPGQNAALTFAGTVGQRVSVQVSGSTLGSTAFAVKSPAGVTLVTSTTGGSGPFFDTLTLAENGTYSVTVNPAAGTVGAASVRAYAVPADAVAAVALGGPAATVTTTTPGQNAVVTFNGAAGQVVTVTVTGATMGSTAYTVRKPDGSTLVTRTTGGSTTTFANQALPVAGAYSLYVNPTAGTFGSATVQLTAGTAVASMSTVDSQPDALPIPRRPAAPPAVDPTEAWDPDRFNLAGANWRSHRVDLSTPVEPLRAADGVSAVSGQTLLLNGRPLPDVTLSVDDRSTRTDHSGRFLLAGLAAGHHELLIDGTTADIRGRSFGVFEVGVDVRAGETLVLPYTIWMTRLDTRNAVTIPSPTTRETVITTPKIPDFEVRLPKGTVVTDRHGRVVTSLSITAIPVDRPPFPLPGGVSTPVYFTVQPGGSYVFPRGARIIYPNTFGLAEGTGVDFWNYDPEGRGWYVYGRGHVSADGRQILPDPGVRVWEFTGAMLNSGPTGAEDGPGEDGDSAADPVDLATGLFLENHTDITLPDTIPISITRSYRQRDNEMRPFGIGANFGYGLFLESEQYYTEVDLVLPDSGKVHLVRTSAGTGFDDAIFEAVDTTGVFRGATLAWNGHGWDLRRTDGTVLVFGDEAPLQSIRDRHGNTVTITRASGGQTGNITQITSPNGRWLKITYGAGSRISQIQDNGGRAVTYAYDSLGRLTTVTTPGGRTTRYAYDSANRMTTITDARGNVSVTNVYDAQDRVQTQTLADGSVHRFTYVTDAAGAIVSATATEPDGKLNTSTFDQSGRVVNKTFAEGTPQERSLPTVRDATHHMPVEMTDPYGRQTTVEYDDKGNPTSITSLAGTPAAMTGTIDQSGPYGQLLSTTDPAGNTATYGYDAAGNLTSTVDAEGRTTTYTYNSAGQPLTTTDTLGNTTTYTYVRGEMTAITDPLGRVVHRTTDAVGRQVTLTDPLGATRQTVYDADNQVLSETDPLGHTTGYAHDANGNLTGVTDARGHTTTMVYDSLDRLVSMTDPLGRTASRAYDVLGRVTSTTDRRGKTTVTQYNATGQVSFLGYGTGPGPTYESTLAYGYDALDRLVTLTDSAHGVTTLTHNDLDQITSVSTPTGTIGYVYDALGRTSVTTIPNQAPISYAYDDTGRLTSVTQGGTVVSWQRDAAGRVTSQTQPGVTTSYTYDAAAQLAGITYRTGTGGLIGDLAYGRDPAGRIATVSGSLASVTIPSTGPVATFDNADQLTALGGQAYTYDADGNLLSDGVRAYTWNARGELSGVTGPGLAATFGYDPSGRRTRTTVNGATTTYLYDGDSIVQEQTGAARVDRLAGGPDTTLRRTDAAGATTPITDGLGSVIGLVTDAGVLSTRYTYDPYGRVTASGAASANSQQYTGREFDAATGLLNNRLRYYSPDLGRFLSGDPAGFDGGSTNQYRYSMNDPVNLSDPNGDCPICIPIIVGAIYGGVTGVAVSWAIAQLTGRKYTSHDALRDFLFGAVLGGISGGLGAWLRGGAQTVWTLSNKTRGLVIEARLGGNLPESFPIIDKFVNGVATSIKSINTSAKTYQSLTALTNRVSWCINKVAGFQGASLNGVTITANQITGRGLMIAIPQGASPAQMQVLQQMVQYGASRGVNVTIHVIP